MKPQVFHLSSLTFWSLSLVFYHLYHVLPFTHHTHCWRSKYAKISQILICSLIGGQCTEVKKCQIFIVGNCKRYVCYILAYGDDKGFIWSQRSKVTCWQVSPNLLNCVWRWRRQDFCKRYVIIDYKHISMCAKLWFMEMMKERIYSVI